MWLKGKTDRPSESGYTLVEMLVVLAIFIFLVVTVSDFVVRGLKSTTFGYEQDEAVKNARKSLDPMMKEIREAAPAVNGAYMIGTTSTSSLIFYANVDAATNTERIRYYLSGNKIYRGVIWATGTPLSYPAAAEKTAALINYVNNRGLPIFTYFDTNNNLMGSSTASTSAIRMIHLSLYINVTPAIAPADYPLEMDIQIRNLKDNL